MRIPLLIRNHLSSPQRHKVRAQHQHTHQVNRHQRHAQTSTQHRTTSTRQRQTQNTRQQQDQERLKGQGVEVEHCASRVHKPREIARTEHNQQRAKTPIPLQQQNQKRHNNRRNKSPPNRRVTDIQNSLGTGLHGTTRRTQLRRLIVVRGRATQNQPLPRLRRIRMRAAQTRMELKRRDMVLPQGTQILRKPHDTLARVLNRPAAEIRIRRLEPARPGAQIYQQTHTNHLEERGDAVTHQRRQTPLVQTHNTASINIPEHRQQTHSRNEEQRIPLHTHRGTGTHTGRETPQAQTHAWAPRHRRKHTAILACRLRNIARQHAPRLNTVKHQTHKSR